MLSQGSYLRSCLECQTSRSNTAGIQLLHLPHSLDPCAMSSLLEVILLLVWSSMSVNSPRLRAPAPMVASSHPQFLTDTRGAPCKWDPELSGPHAKSITGRSPVCHQGTVLQLPRGQVHDLRRGSSPPAVCQLPSQPVRVHHFLAPQHSQAWSQRRDFAFQKAHGSTVRL